MLIGIVGKARVGKDVFAVMLAEELFNLTRQRYVLMAYAHELKIRVQKDFDMSYEQLWGNEKEVEDRRYNKVFNYHGEMRSDKDELTSYWTPREILQHYGEFYRSIDYNFWVNHLFEIVKDREYKNVIVTDIRYINEAESIVERKGVLIKIVRNKDKTDSIHGKDHISETTMDDYNRMEFVIENNGTLKEFNLSAKEIANILVDRKNK
ncbi:hypothetical protein KAW18_03625 [candidate division WOR-3 bacterium]|nr:hypothetical protein [Candidatus Parcubacteria bacterium]MCK4526436.1 hypothetical protein [candidate division WOR-3 bacterium]